MKLNRTLTGFHLKMGTFHLYLTTNTTAFRPVYFERMGSGFDLDLGAISLRRRVVQQ
jgi:hypothetical protein